jgi:hypothetical protein
MFDGDGSTSANIEGGTANDGGPLYGRLGWGPDGIGQVQKLDLASSAPKIQQRCELTYGM